MWVRNKATDHVWEVTGELAERLAGHPDYEVVDDPTPPAPKKPAKAKEAE